MGSSSSIMKPQQLVEFRKANTNIDSIGIPAPPETRTLTDKKGFIFLAVTLIILMPLLIYTLTKADLRFLTNPTDLCGNFCGLNNSVTFPDFECNGMDKRDTPYFVVDGFVCVENCDEKEQLCYKSYKWNQPDDDVDIKSIDDAKVFEIEMGAWWKYFISILITIVLTVLTLMVLRYMPAPFVWTSIILLVAFLLILPGVLWYLYSVAPSDSGYQFGDVRSQTAPKSALLAPALLFTLFSVIMLIILIAIFKKIGLVIQLYKEGAKVLAAMPLLVLLPIITFIFQYIILILLLETTVYMISARDPYFITSDLSFQKVEYRISGATIFTIILNLFVASWILRLFAGIHFMTVAGSVATWYFSKNKQYLGWPIWMNFKIVSRFHLGTVTFGAMLMTLFSVVKQILKVVFRNACCRCCTIVCCSWVEVLFKFLSEQSYIETAIHGQSYLRSAKRATKLLLANANSLIAVDCVGSFIVVVIICVLTIITTGISYALFMNLGQAAILPITICAIINIIIITVIFGTFDIVIDTLFLCFCEDMVINDGVSKPYAMSRGLMEFVENSKKIYGVKN